MKLDNKTRIHQAVNILPFIHDQSPKFKKNSYVVCQKRLAKNLTVSPGKNYLVLEDSFLSQTELGVNEYVMIINDRGTWGIYLAEMFLPRKA